MDELLDLVMDVAVDATVDVLLDELFDDLQEVLTCYYLQILVQCMYVLRDKFESNN